MKNQSKPEVTVLPSEVFDQLGLDIEGLRSKISETQIEQLVSELYGFLQQASQVEHLLAMQYLFAAFSMKKYPEEFADYASGDQQTKNQRIAQMEYIRRWEAEILFVSRQEMEHLNLVQNLIVILGQQPYLFRPNFPVPGTDNLLQLPINLMPFSEHAIEVFRYWEKPDSVTLPDPFQMNDVPKGIQNWGKKGPHPTEAHKHDADSVRKAAFARIEEIINGAQSEPDEMHTIEELYEHIWLYFAVLFELRLIDGQNLMRVSEEHFGFNIKLDPIVDGKYFSYVDTVIRQIIEEGEGASIDDSNFISLCDGDLMGSHFCVFTDVLKQIKEQAANSGVLPFTPALPVVWNPTISNNPEYHNAPLPEGEFDDGVHVLTPVTNAVAKAAMALFNKGYDVLIRMLNGYFTNYEIDYTTGIRPPEVNAFFRTSFYPFMTMIIRPLGELICRLPADESYVPVPGQVPPRTAGPNFFFNIPNVNDRQAELEATKVFDDPLKFITIFTEMAIEAKAIADLCVLNNYHAANYQAKDARDFSERFTYMSQNLTRIAQNFEAYWSQEMIAPVSSKGFQNFNDKFN